jgi:2'-5' RNA ligase
MKPGIVVMCELRGALADHIRNIQQRFDPRMAGELPPHVTIAGSSGMGPILASTTDEELRVALEPVARATTPFSVALQPPRQFMQSNVVTLQIDPNGLIRALHERIKSSGLAYEQPRFTFTPHLTLSFYPELSREKLRELLCVRITEPLLIDAIQVYRATDLTRTTRVFALPLGTPPREDSTSDTPDRS